MSPKRVLIFSLAYHPAEGGAEIAVKEITSRLPDIEFDMVTLRFDKKHLPFERIGNVNVYRLDTFKNAYPFKAASFGHGLHKKRQYDATWAIMANWAGFAALFFKYFHPSVQYVLTLQEGDPIEYIENKVRLVRPLWKRIFTHADKVQAISHFLARWAKDVGYKGSVEVIPNGVDVRKFENTEPKANNTGILTLITTSRLVEKNGVEDVIRSLKFLPAHIHFKILGVGELGAHLMAVTKKLHLEERVKFEGFVKQDDIPAFLHHADIFIRPSLSEGMGNSFIEAMAAGLPVIATPVGGIVDFLVDGQTGLFVEVKNPRLIAFQVQKLISDRVLRDKLIINAKRMVLERYEWDFIASEMKRRVFDPVLD